MFNLIDIGERAGSGIPNIFRIWREQGWKKPIITELAEPDRIVFCYRCSKMKVAIKVQKLPHKKSPSLSILQIMLLQNVQIFLSDCRLTVVEIGDTWRLNHEKSKVSQQSVIVPKEQIRQRRIHGNSSFVHVFCKKEYVLQYAFLLYWIKIPKNTAFIL